MLKIQQSYCHNYENVHSYFVTYRSNQNADIEVEKDILYVKGEETYLGITRKTVDGMEYLLNHLQNIDYVVRSNISTVINIPELLTYCQSLPKKNVYTSGIMNELQWFDPVGGIVDKSLWGTKYASGTSIILSKDVAESIVQRKREIRHDVVDDVSIGVFMTKSFPNNYGTAPVAPLVIVPFDLDTSTLNKNAAFYRTRTGKCRKRDIKNMQTVCDLIYDKNDKKEGFDGLSDISEKYVERNDEVITYAGIVLGILAVGFIVGSSIFRKK
jgi:hypothetical protein